VASRMGRPTAEVTALGTCRLSWGPELIPIEASS
jgi:hypothetical protein